MKTHSVRILILAGFALLLLFASGCASGMTRHQARVDAQLDVAKSALNSGDYDKVREEATRTKQEYYRLADVEKVDAEAREAIRKRELAKEYLDMGKKAFDDGNYLVAIHAFETVLEEDPGNKEAELHLKLSRKAQETLAAASPVEALGTPPVKQEVKKLGVVTVSIKGLGRDKLTGIQAHLKSVPGIGDVRQTENSQGRGAFEVTTDLAVGKVAEMLGKVPGVPLEIIKEDPEARFIYAKGAASAYEE